MNRFNVHMDEETSRKYAIFQAAEFGQINLIHSLLKKGLDVDGQDEEGDTLLHHAAKWGHSALVTYLLRRKASAVIKNKKGRMALLEAYTNNYMAIARKITSSVVERSSIKASHHFQDKKINHDEKVKLENFINECKKHIRKNYLNRGLFSRLMARHNERAKALMQALNRCASIKEAKGLIKSQCDLFEKGKATRSIPSNLLTSRWSAKIKNKPNNLINSSFYKVLNTMPGQKSAALLSERSHRQINSMPKFTSSDVL